MACDKCKSDRIMSISGKTSDLFSCQFKGIEHVGYVPSDIIIGKDGWGDYINIDLCMECGKVQGKFPVSDSRIKAAIKDA